MSVWILKACVCECVGIENVCVCVCMCILGIDTKKRRVFLLPVKIINSACPIQTHGDEKHESKPH